MVIDLGTKADFDKALIEAADKLVAVDFTAVWCGPCRMIGPKFVAFAESGDYPNVVFYKVDVDKNSETAESEEVSAMPTFKFYKNGKKVDELVGASEPGLKAILDKHK
ncbi:thioredoxin-like [Lineus longissimus]|uniref:thioredoxin-like n=1 Tax=Lineus longissimus TaxID=88925 RepID=UPI002B4F8CD6